MPDSETQTWILEDKLMTDDKKIRCAWEGCWRSTTRHPFLDDWAYLIGWGPAVKAGYYCKEHADAIEAVEMEGGFDEEAA
jgi:hypothetical protein